MNASVLSLILLLTLVALTVTLIERSRLTLPQISLIALLAALIGVTRIPVAAIPNVQVATALIICSGLAFGTRAGLLVGFLTPIISNLALGHGPWTLWQMLAWGLCGMISGLPFVQNLARPGWKLGLYGLLWGFGFGWINNIWIWLTLIQELSPASFVATCIVSSAAIDLIHGLNNLLILTFFSPAILRIMNRYRPRFLPRPPRE